MLFGLDSGQRECAAMHAFGQTLWTNSAPAQHVVRCWSDSVLDLAAQRMTRSAKKLQRIAKERIAGAPELDDYFLVPVT